MGTEQEGYQPSEDEIKLAEEHMDGNEHNQSKIREFKKKELDRWSGTTEDINGVEISYSPEKKKCLIKMELEIEMPNSELILRGPEGIDNEDLAHIFRKEVNDFILPKGYEVMHNVGLFLKENKSDLLDDHIELRYYFSELSNMFANVGNSESERRYLHKKNYTIKKTSSFSPERFEEIISAIEEIYKKYDLDFTYAENHQRKRLHSAESGEVFEIK